MVRSSAISKDGELIEGRDNEVDCVVERGQLAEGAWRELGADRSSRCTNKKTF